MIGLGRYQVKKPVAMAQSHLPPLILASTSRFRRELLERLKIPFDALAPGIEEDHLPSELPQTRAVRLALAKARAIAVRRPEAVVIGGDQVATCGGAVLDKPGSAEGCRRQLGVQSGRATAFYTAVAVVCIDRQFSDEFLDITEVQFRSLSADEIERYVALDEPQQCAGSFRSESLGIALFEHLRSADPSGLVGLPLIRLARTLRGLGYLLP
jgi:septum formation protein